MIRFLATRVLLFFNCYFTERTVRCKNEDHKSRWQIKLNLI